MDLAWCPVCDKQTFAIENLYCSEACRKKDALSILNEECYYEFPRCSSQKPYQSPYNSPYTSPKSSPTISPTNTTTMIMDYNFQLTYIMSSSPSDLLLHGMAPSSPKTNRTGFFNNTADSPIIKARRVSKKNISLTSTLI